MSRPRKDVPNYPSKPHSSGQARIILGGRAIYLGAFGSPESHATYRRVIGEYLTTGAMPAIGGPRIKLTVEELATQYWLWAEKRHQRKGKLTAQGHKVKASLVPLVRNYGETLAIDFGPKAMRALLEILNQPQPCGRCKATGKIAGKKKRDCPWCKGTKQFLWSVCYIRHCSGIIKGIWDWAVDEEILPGHALHRALRSRAKTKADRRARRILPVPLADMQATVEQLGAVVSAMVRVQHLCGMRPIEVIGMRRCDINFEGIVPEVGKFEGVWVYDVADDFNKNAHKDQARVVFLGPKAQTILKRFLSCQPEEFLFSPKETMRLLRRAGNRSARLQLVHPPGERYKTDSYDQAIGNAVRRAGVPHWTPNQLRHLRATEIRSQYSSDHARVVLGHALAGITGRYAEPDLEKAAKVAREIG